MSKYFYYGIPFNNQPELIEINRDFKDYILEWEKEYGGSSQASKYAIDWYEKTLKDKDDLRVTEFSDTRFVKGKMYKFRYKPKYKDRLSYWDRSPMIISLGMAGNNKCELGINLNFLPKEVRYWMVGEIFRLYKKNIIDESYGSYYRDAKNQRGINLDYDLLKRNLGEWGLGFAIRQYYMSNTYENSVVCYEDWIKMSICDWNDYDNLQSNALMNLYLEHLNNLKKK